MKNGKNKIMTRKPLPVHQVQCRTKITNVSNLSNNNIGDEYNTGSQFEHLTPIPKLLHLNLSFNNLNKNDMKRILTAQTELKTLDFSRNVIDMEGLTLLIPSFEAMAQLRHLNISSKSYRNQLNLDVLSHITSLRLNK
jgi:hypothetical protein